MAFHINQGNPNPQILKPGDTDSITIEMYVDGNPVGPGEIIQVKLPDGVIFPATGEIRYMQLDAGINRPLPVESREPDGSIVRFKAEAIGNKPEGFYSVNVQALPNATPGDRTVADGIAIGGTPSPLSIRIGAARPVEQRAYGVVSADGRASSGRGFQVARVGAGDYRITFTNPFVAPPAVTATVYGLGLLLDNAHVDLIEPGSVRIVTGDSNGAFADRPFSFIAVGEAPPLP
ncbi:hypothetical protein [Streptomyces telluris]|uniref:Uncharacterized protein n=1 Tax=Streptomyces telluris TaxID=2720021 RepID=A0A9X2LIR2_9ACTN|nr:hypothetical protein [Streptomyces telluris]MCQ8772052.1 hypothetical protein [Streptomyces telluris]NJP78834.1 hypothetical protein [Streptomyces telluris]